MGFSACASNPALLDLARSASRPYPVTATNLTSSELNHPRIATANWFLGTTGPGVRQPVTLRSLGGSTRAQWSYEMPIIQGAGRRVSALR